MAIRLTTYEHSADVPALPGTNIFHSTELFSVLEQTPGYRPVLLVATEDGQLLGKLLCITRPSARLAHFVHTTYIYGTGEYFPSSRRREEVFEEFLSYFTQCFLERSFLLEFRNLEEPLFGYRYFRQNGYFAVKWLRVENTLRKDTMLQWMSSSRKRQIAQGLKRGATMEVASSEEEIREFFGLLKKYYSPKIHRHLPEESFFLALQREQQGERLSRTFLVRYKGKLIGGSICLFSGDKAYLLFSGGLRKSYPLHYPGVLAVWKAISYCLEQGYEKFEFINAGLPFQKYGYRDFILRFGGRQLSSRRWFKIRWNWLNRLLVWLYL